MAGRYSEHPSREDRLDELERRVRRLEEALLGAAASPAPPVAAALSRAEAAPAPAGTEAPPPPAEPVGAAREGYGGYALDVLAQTGWSVLALAGAFLVRALTSNNGTQVTL